MLLKFLDFVPLISILGCLKYSIFKNNPFLLVWVLPKFTLRLAYHTHNSKIPYFPSDHHAFSIWRWSKIISDIYLSYCCLKRFLYTRSLPIYLIHNELSITPCFFANKSISLFYQILYSIIDKLTSHLSVVINIS